MKDKYKHLLEKYNESKELYMKNPELFRANYLKSLRELLFTSEKKLEKMGLQRKIIESEHTRLCIN